MGSVLKGLNNDNDNAVTPVRLKPAAPRSRDKCAWSYMHGMHGLYYYKHAYLNAENI